MSTMSHRHRTPTYLIITAGVLLTGSAAAASPAELDATMMPMNKAAASAAPCAECVEELEIDHNASQRAKTRSAPEYPEASRMNDEQMVDAGAPDIEPPGVSLPAGDGTVALPVATP